MKSYLFALLFLPFNNYILLNILQLKLLGLFLKNYFLGLAISRLLSAILQFSY